MHDLSFDHEHPSEEERKILAEIIWEADNVELRTVGVDVGSSTSHLMFARVHLQRLTEGLSSQFVVVAREILWKSPILLTPYRADYSIDAEALARFIDDGYQAAGLAREDIDSGAVILTGEALKRRNAREIADLFSAELGKFVCASAGHHLEALMAAHGSGAAGLSRQSPQQCPQHRYWRRDDEACAHAWREGARDGRVCCRRAPDRVGRTGPDFSDRGPGPADRRGVRSCGRVGADAEPQRRRGSLDKMADVIVEMAGTGPLSPIGEDH